MSGHTADVARPRASGGPARTVDQVLARAGLPDALASLVRTTVARTRLRRRERCDIARELVSHLAAGLDAGVTPTQLAERFGDPRAVAPLLRAAARRRRSRLDQFAGRVLLGTGLSILGLVVVYTGLAIRLATLEATPSFDPYQRVEAMTPFVRPEERAWPHYRDALTWHRELRTGDPQVDVGLAVLGEIEGAEALDADLAAIAARGPEIEQLRRASAMPGLGWDYAPALPPVDDAWFDADPVPTPPGFDGMLVGMQLPYIMELRAAGRLLAADARVALEHQPVPDAARAVDDLIAILGVARHVGELPVVITQLVETSLVELAATEAVRMLERSPGAASDEDLQRLAAALAGIDPSTWRLDLAAEELWFRDIVQHVFTDDGHGGGVILPEKALALDRALIQRSAPSRFDREAVATFGGPLVAGVVAGRRETLALAERLYGLVDAEADLPIVDRSHLLDQEIGRIMNDSWERMRYPLNAVLMPAISRASDQRAAARPAVDGAIVAIALERWRRRHGAWPARLEDLVPAFLPAVPPDAFDGQPLRYRLDPAGPLVWSVGPDGVDDDGLPVASETASGVLRRSMRRTPAADWVIFDGRTESPD